MTAFDTAWRLMKSIDDDFNDDEFIDNSQFNNPVAAKVDEIMEIFGGSSPLECYSCGFEGPTSTFVGWHGGPGRKCPECKSYEVHKYDPSIPVNPEWLEDQKKKDKKGGD